jgi:hypothetical protein
MVVILATAVGRHDLVARAQVAGDPARRVTIKLFFVALGDAGRSGKKIGCDDSLVAVDRAIPTTDTPLAAAIAELVSLRDKHHGQSGLSNALAQSSLKVQSVKVVDGTAEIRLAGSITLSGACDAPRVDSQIRETALQFPAITRVSVFVNDVPLERVLSAK